MRILLAIIFVVICGTVGVLLKGTIGESQWYLGGFIVGFITNAIVGKGE